MNKVLKIIDTLCSTHDITKDDLNYLLTNITKEEAEILHEKARLISQETFSNKVFIRGLIELTNYCKNDCLYCGLRASNTNCNRYRLTLEQILTSCKTGNDIGFKTFVLQGGEDPFFTDEKLVEIVSNIRSRYPDSAITLSLGERSEPSYRKLFEAGANRFLLRHETATSSHYAKLHPSKMKLESRLECLNRLKEIGYQVGTGFMVGSPHQTIDNIVDDILFIKNFQPQMIGVGPFIPHHDTPFADEPAGSVTMTVNILAILRLLLPTALIPATTALGTLDSDGREKGILAGANVIMPNLSPVDVRKKYELYNNKLCTGDETAEAVKSLNARLNKIGYEITKARGDHPKYERKK